jgi:toxin YoeB
MAAATRSGLRDEHDLARGAAGLHAALMARTTYWLAPTGPLSTINRLIDNALRDRSTCIGKPEPLRHMLAGAWSRRFSDEHRLVTSSSATASSSCGPRFHHT